MTSPPSYPVQAPACPPPPKPQHNVWWVALAAVIVLLVAALVWWFTSPDASYRNGVSSADRQIVESGVIAALVSDGERGDALVITDADASTAKVTLQVGGPQQEETLSTQMPLSELLTHPGAGCAALKAKCASITASTLTIGGLGELTYSEESARWQSSDGTEFPASVIFGRVDDLVIGNRTQAQFAGAGETSQIPVDSITAFDRATGEVVWTKYFDQPTLVAIGDNTIYVAETTLQWPDAFAQLDDDNLTERYEQMRNPSSGNNAIYRLAPATKKNTEVFADAPEQVTDMPSAEPTGDASPTPSAEPTPSPTPKPAPKKLAPFVATDAITKFDLRNTYLPRAMPSSAECAGPADEFWNFSLDLPTPPRVHKLPDNPDPCLWMKMQDGISTSTMADMGPDYGSFPEAKPDQVEYVDLNGDGYLDALISGAFWSAYGWVAVIFDPADPNHPYMTFMWGTQYQTGKLDSDGTLILYGDDTCITARVGVSGQPPKFTTWQPEKPVSENRCY